MGHTQPTQNNNNQPLCLSSRKKIIFLLSRHGHGHGHVPVYARVGHIKRTMQEPELPSDWPCMAQVARLQYNAAGWNFG